MGCCFSKNGAAGAPGASARRCQPEDRSPPSPELETVKEVLSETPSAKPRPEPVVANVATPKEREVVEKAEKRQDSADAAASDLGSCVSLSLATDEVSEAASESSVATSSVTGPARPAPRRPVSADLGPAAARRDRAVVAASYGVRSRSARGSPTPPRSVTRDRSARRSPSPRPSSEQRRAASPVQRKPPVPVRPSSGRVSPRRAQQAEARPPVAFPPPSQPEDDDAVTVASEASVPNVSSAGGGVQGGERGGDGKESLENPLVSLECFIFL